MNISPKTSAAVDGIFAIDSAWVLVRIMSHSHVEDFALCKAVLQRQRSHADVFWIGLIGSASKWQGFQKRLLEQGFTVQEIAYIVSPIGVAGIVAKGLAALAVSVAAQLLQLHALWIDKAKPSHPSPEEQAIGLDMGKVEA